MDPILSNKPFPLRVTHVRHSPGLVHVLGQTDAATAVLVERYLAAVREQLEGGSPPRASALSAGQAVLARHQGGWHRARVLAPAAGTGVEVLLEDLGPACTLGLAALRTGVPGEVSRLPGLARSFVLGEVLPAGPDWSRPALQFVRDAVEGSTCRALVTHRVRGHSFLRLYKRDSREPLSHDMVQCGFAVAGYPNIDSLPPGPEHQPRLLARQPCSPLETPLTVVVPGPALSPGPVAPSPSPLFRPVLLEPGSWHRCLALAGRGQVMADEMFLSCS
jgi:hypothetical protein